MQYRSNEYPNLCLLAELVISLSGSNSAVERAFSTLRNTLCDKRVCLKHSTLEDLLLVKLNDGAWNEDEREEIIERALQIYLRKRRKRKLDDKETPTVQEVESSADESEYRSSPDEPFVELLEIC